MPAGYTLFTMPEGITTLGAAVRHTPNLMVLNLRGVPRPAPVRGVAAWVDGTDRPLRDGTADIFG